MDGARRPQRAQPPNGCAPCSISRLRLNTVGRSLADLKPGEGAIVEEQGRKVAGYRDASGQVTMLSKKCTHLGCSVQWNPTLATWDCPCHGSRFEATGKVVNGPAQRDLERIQVP